MSEVTVLMILAACLVILLATGAPVAFVIGIVSFGAAVWLTGLTPTLNLLVIKFQAVYTSFVFLCLPFFILMAEYAVASGAVTELYQAVKMWMGRIPGGLAVGTTIFGALFGTISGSSIAAIATVGSMAEPELRKEGYSKKLTAGAICAAGGLDILIPPSLIAVIYAGLAQTSVGAQLMAGFIPGLILAAGYIVVTVIWSWKWGAGQRRPDLQFPTREKLVALARVLPILLVALMVFLTIYFGVATPTEAAAFGTLGTLALLLWKKRWDWPILRGTLLIAARSTAMILIIVLSGYLLAYVVSYIRIPLFLSGIIESMAPSKYLFIFMAFILYTILGMFLEGAGMLILTLPVLLPLVDQMGISPVWFGVFFMLNVEIGMITPPVGVGLFAFKAVVGDRISSEEIILGMLPFFIVDIAVIVLISIFPQIPLWLTPR